MPENGFACLSVNLLNNEFFCSGAQLSADTEKALQIWRLNPDTLSATNYIKKGSLKRQKISDSYVSPVESISCSGGIASLHWSSPSRIYVGGQDHQIKIVNVDTKKIEEIIFTNHKVPTSIDSIQDSLILTGHEDSLIRLWDIRVSSAGSSEKKFKSQYEGHDSWVSQVRVNLNAENVFVSGSFDGTVKLWDLRNEERPIATLKRKDKSD